MEEITNFRLKEFLQQTPQLIEDYSKLLKNLEPQQTKNRIQDLKLKDVEFIKQNITSNEALGEIFESMEELNEADFMNLRVTEFYALYNSILQQLENLMNMEDRELTPNHHNHKWEAVEGGKRLSKLGILPTIDNLAGGDILKYNEILELPYITVFKKLMLDRIKADIQHDMEKIKTNKNDV